MNHTNFTCGIVHNVTHEDCPDGIPKEYLSPEVIILLDIVYVFIVVVGFTGNLMTCAATVMQKSMRRSIHLYVFNLAVCDLLIIIFYVPNEMMRIGHQARYVWGLGMCMMTSTVLPVAVNCTVFTLLAISIDRARGVLRPIEWSFESKGGAHIIIPMIWVLSLAMAVPVLIHSKLVPFNCGEVCMDIWKDPSHQTRYWITIFALTFATPLFIIFILHVIMIYVINHKMAHSERHDNKKMIKMTVSIVMIFTVCTGSQHFYFFLLTFNPCFPTEQSSADAILFFGSNMLVIIQSACNPILYGKFREDFNVAYRRMVKAIGEILRPGRRVRAEYSSLKNLTAADGKTVIDGRSMTMSETIPDEKTEPWAVNTPLMYPLDGDPDEKIPVTPKSGLGDRKDRNLLQVPQTTRTNNKPIYENGSLHPSSDGYRSPIRDANTVLRSNSTAIDEPSNTVINNSDNSDVRHSTSNPPPNLKKNDTFDNSFDDDNELMQRQIQDENESLRQQSVITNELRKISRLLNELRDTEVLEGFTDKERTRLSYLKLTDDEKRSLRSSYPSVEWLEVLHLLRDSEETDL